jgi:hypothetical protein
MAEEDASFATSAPVKTIVALRNISRMTHPFDGDLI